MSRRLHDGAVLALVALLLLLSAGPAASGQRSGTSVLRVVVKDQSGGVIPGALVRARSAESDVPPLDGSTDPLGTGVLTGIAPGRYDIEVSFPGFETRVLRDARIRAGENHREVVLRIQKLDESVSVGRDPAAAASDPAADRFATTLSRGQIDALPDDPGEMEAALKEMAGPGATIRVDGFRGGRLPPKSQIRAIRFSRNMFAAEHHGGGLVFIDIVTQPGLGPVRGTVDYTFRDAALNARNASQPEKGPEQSQQYGFSLSGTLLENRTSFSLAGGGASLYDAANIFAAVPGGARPAPIRRPAERANFTARIDHALTAAHTLRGSFQQNEDSQQNLGVGGFDLAERAYGRTVRDSVFRVSEGGPLSRTVFGETRLQLRNATTELSPGLELPTLRVLDAFTAGGAQQAGTRRSAAVEWATNVDWATRSHSVRGGLLFEAGKYTSTLQTEYLGTYTFGSLADYDRAQPSTYTRRTGDPLVKYSHWQAGVFLQDDWRARKNLTISAGLRQELQSHMTDRSNVSPRAGLTWSPFKSGRTTVRAGGGVFHDWLDADTFEQTLRVDGVRQQELVIRNPGYPDPSTAGSGQEILPPGKYVLAGGLALPRRTMFNTGIGQQLSDLLSINVAVTHTRASGRLRGAHANAPDEDGSRPFPAFGNIVEVQGTGRMRGTSVHTGVNFNARDRRTLLFANYSWMRHENDSDGPFALPADRFNPGAEWGPAAGIARHQVSGMLTTTLPLNLRLGVTATGRTGAPYNITTGRDDNGDSVINDRPRGVHRNSARDRGAWDTAMRLSYTFGFGERSTASGPGGANVVIRRVGGNVSAGDLLGEAEGEGAQNKRFRLELHVSILNVLNHANPLGFSGVMTSPFFGKPTGALPGRRIDLGMRVSF